MMNIEELKQKLIAGDAEAIEILTDLIYCVDNTKIKIVYRTREKCANIIKYKYDRELSKEALDRVMDDYDADWDSLAGDFSEFLTDKNYDFDDLESEV